MEAKELTRTVAIYQCMQYGGFIISNYAEGQKESANYVRVSEPMTITFAARKRDDVVAALVAGIDDQIVEAQQRVRDLERKKSELLALPAPESA